MPLIVVAGTPINFPNTGNSPVWSDAVIQFAQAVAQTLNGFAGAFDILPQVYNMTSNLNTDVAVSNLDFPPSNVTGAFIRYTVTRSTNNPLTVDEAGTLTIDYNSTNPSGHKWEIQREYIGDAQVTFAITDAGQVTFSSTALAGGAHVGQIQFVAQALVSE